MGETVLQLVRAFLVGGLICAAAQILIDRTRLTPARILVSLVVTGVLLDAVGLFAPLKEFAGAGATTPLIGFGALIAEGVRKAVDEEGLIGALTGGLSRRRRGNRRRSRLRLRRRPRDARKAKAVTVSFLRRSGEGAFLRAAEQRNGRRGLPVFSRLPPERRWRGKSHFFAEFRKCGCNFAKAVL